MNCLEFRRVVTTDPREEGPALVAHAADCPACAQLQRELRSRDGTLRSALKVDLPPGLADRVLYAQAAAARPSRAKFLAMAAALVLGVGTGLLAAAPTPSAAALVRHVAAEKLSDAPADAEAPARLAARAKAFGGTVDGLDVRRVNLCIVGARVAIHVVASGEHGPVDVMILPGWDAPDRILVDTAGVKGWIAPGRHSGLAVLGRSGVVPSEADLARVRAAVSWEPVAGGALGRAASRLRGWASFVAFMR